MIDIASIKIKAGNGGDGKVSFKHAKYVPKGGPDGGDGGNGGSVFFVSDTNLATLMDFRSKSSYHAEDGDPGGKEKMSGKSGEDLYIKVPVGTLIYEVRDGVEILVTDMLEPGISFMAARGGKGGKGNFRFRSSTNRIPVQYTPGTKGAEKEIKLEIKLVADVGLVGLPNAGKSTLINKLTNANAKVASYPFTTLSPNLGSYLLRSGKNIIISDIPGLIEGASQGKGLGDEFLRHIERTRMIIHIVDPTDSSHAGLGAQEEEISLCDNAVVNYRIIRKELMEYHADLENKLEIVVVNKMDITEVKQEIEDIKTRLKEEFGVEALGISAVTGEGLDDLDRLLIKYLEASPEKKAFQTAVPVKLYTAVDLPNKRMVFGTDTVLEKEMPK